MTGRCLYNLAKNTVCRTLNYSQSPSSCNNSLFIRCYSDRKVVTASPPQIISKSKTILVSRPVEKKKKKDLPNENGYSSVVACVTAANYNLSGLRESILRLGDYNLVDLTSDSKSTCVLAVSKTDSFHDDRCLFYFKEGAIVLWNCDDTERSLVLDHLKLFEFESYKEEIINREMEVMLYMNSPNTGRRSHITDDVIHLSSTDHHRYMDMYAFSNSLALSVKLGAFESFLEDYVNNTEFLTEDLKHGKRIGMSRRQVLRKTGELFALRHYINLSTDLTDTPDFYWDRDHLLPVYQTACNYFSISLRTKVLNEKLNHCIELIELVSSHLNDRHHVRLEWMIIILIMIEIVFEVLHYLN